VTWWKVDPSAFLGIAAFAAATIGSVAPEAAADAVDAALDRLQSGDALVADRAVEDLVAAGEPGAAALRPLLADSRRDVRAGAIRGLGLLRDREALPELVEALRASLVRTEPDVLEDRYFRVLLIQALGRIGEPQSAPILLEAANGADEFERAHAGISLFLLGEDPGYDLVRDCLAHPEAAIRNVAVEGLSEVSSDRARPLVLPMVDDPSWVVRESAFRALLGWPADDATRAAMARGSRDPSWYVRQTVAERR